MKSVRVIGVFILSLLLGGVAQAEFGIKWGGDLRYRYEMTDDKTTGSVKRNRHRIRARLKAKAKVNDRVDVVISVASGNQAVATTTQTLDDYGSNKTIDLDMAYFQYKVMDKFFIWGGKMKNTLYRVGKSDMVFDHDWTPEGLAFNYKHELKHFSFFINGSHIQIDERKSTKDDSAMNAAQLGFKVPFAGTALTLGYGTLNFTNLKGYEPHSTSGNSVETVNSTSVFSNDYQLQQIFLSYKLKIKGLGIETFGESIKNRKADSEDTGMIYGVKLGKAKKKGSWALRVNYRKIEKDALVGALSDLSTFGGTDGKGMVYGLKYALSNNSIVGLTHFDVKRSISSAETEYKKTRLDYTISF
jgi:hypothetical protein